MKTLPKTFHKLGWSYRELARCGMVGLWEKRYQDRTTYDVAIIQVSQSSNREALENLPWSLEWGTKGFTFTDIESAERKYAELVNSQGADSRAQDAPQSIFNT